MAVLLLKITVVLALGLAAASLLRRARAAIRHLVLASTLAATVAIPAAGLLLPTVSVPVPVAASNALAVAIAEPAVRRHLPAEPIGIVSATPTMPRYSLSTLLAMGWAAGAVLWLGALALALFRLDRLRRTAVPWPHGQALMERIAAEAGVRRIIDVARHEALGAPVTGGVVTPIVLLPREAESWDEQDLRQAFLHELEHIHRHDWIVQVAARALCALYWFHPLAWITLRQLCLEAERACDDAVVTRVEGAAYAQQLLTLAQRVSTAEAVPMLSMARRSDLSVRVRALLDATMQRGRAGRRAFLASVAAAGVIVAALSPLRAAGAVRMAADEQTPQRPAAQSAVARALADDLIESAQKGNVREVSELLASGADVNSVIEGDGTALIAAARSNRLEMVTFLVEQGADVNLGVEGDGNPLIMASERGARNIVQYLLDRGADANLGIAGDGSPLIVAARSGRLPLVTLLVERGANVNLAVQGDGNPLIAASARGAIDVVRYLLDHGADIDAIVPGDENALINASQQGHLAVVQLLVQRGANVNAGVWKDNVHQARDGSWSTNPVYRSPLSSALSGGHTEVVEFLRANGATN